MKPAASAARSALLLRTALFAGLWWVIVQGNSAAWLVGVPAVAAAALVSRGLGNTVLPRISPRGLLAFATLFLRESVAGGIDVARRTLGRRVRVRPGFADYRMHLRDPGARLLLVNCISLLPGTLTADLDGDRVHLHLLDAGQDPQPQLQRLEQTIARLYATPMETTDA